MLEGSPSILLTSSLESPGLGSAAKSPVIKKRGRNRRIVILIRRAYGQGKTLVESLERDAGHLRVLGARDDNGVRPH